MGLDVTVSGRHLLEAPIEVDQAAALSASEADKLSLRRLPLALLGVVERELF